MDYAVGFMKLRLRGIGVTELEKKIKRCDIEAMGLEVFLVSNGGSIPV